jgi:Tol biopolymer transport system component
MRMWAWAAAICAVLSLPSGARAAFPGENGKIAYLRGQSVWTVDPDGANRTQITQGARDGPPHWSPDGRQIAFASTRANPNPLTCSQCSDVHVMDADGSNVQQVTTDGISSGPSWSPDGTRLAFGRAGHIWTSNVDGTDQLRLTPNRNPDCFREYYRPIWSPDGTQIATNGVSLCFDHEYPISCVHSLSWTAGYCWFTSGAESLQDWSPGSQRVVFGTMGIESGGYGMYTIGRDGTGFNELTDETHDDGDAGAAWSPDGRRIVFARATSYGFDPLLHILDADDGDNLTPLSAGDAYECCPDWQPIPVNAYPRPKSASPTEIALVPAYEPCTAPNRTHGPPLASGSCNPPARTPGELTVGTPDANGQGPRSTSEVHLQVLPGVPATPADEADVRLYGTVNDVRLASDLSDYTGALEARVTLRITDKDNTPSPSGPGAATTQDLPYSFPIPCAATADANVGADCSFDTTAEAFVPGIAKEGRRAIWQLGRLAIHDGSGGLFMRQGVFVP